MRAVAPLLCGQAGRAGGVQAEQEKALWSLETLLVPKRAPRQLGGTLDKGLE